MAIVHPLPYAVSRIYNTAGALLYTVSWDSLEGTNLAGVNLTDADLRGVYLAGANFEGANLRRAHFAGAFLKDANFRGANLAEADMRESILAGADLTNADLRGTKLLKAYLCGATIDGALLDQQAVGGPGHVLCALTDREWAMIRLCRLGAAEEVESK
jgi:uncharacterized protein YjbI with pentapeptide repeats